MVLKVLTDLLGVPPLLPAGGLKINDENVGERLRG